VMNGQMGGRGSVTSNGVCNMCHADAQPYWRQTKEILSCVNCHGDLQAKHTATPGSDYVLVFAENAHDDAMQGDGTVFMACSICHSTNLVNIHDNNCTACHAGSPSPKESLGGSWAGGCQQGACHTTKHADVSDKHNEVTDYAGESNCTDCHGQYWNHFPPLSTDCANCHAIYNSNDTVPPVTTSDAQSSYVGAARINFSITDNGGKVGIGTTYSRLDSGTAQFGTSILVGTIGSHELEFWTVDQAGNEELPHNFAYFTITQDTIPPVTTSNAYSHYVNAVTITLTATDNGSELTTFYKITGGTFTGDLQTGTSIYIPELPGNISYTLEFWSVDSSGNEELPHNIKNITMHGGTGTIRLVWWNSDTTGSPCPDDPNARVEWEINRSGFSTISGDAGCPTDPNWSGVNDITVPVSLSPYYVDIWWFESDDEDLVEYPFTEVSEHGEVIRLSY